SASTTSGGNPPAAATATAATPTIVSTRIDMPRLLRSGIATSPASADPRQRLYEPPAFCQGCRSRMRTGRRLVIALLPAGQASGAAAEGPLRRIFHALVGGGDAGDERCELGEDVKGGQTEPGALEVVVPAGKKAWEASLGGEEAARPFVRARLSAWP